MKCDFRSLLKHFDNILSQSRGCSCKKRNHERASLEHSIFQFATLACSLNSPYKKVTPLSLHCSSVPSYSLVLSSYSYLNHRKAPNFKEIYVDFTAAQIKTLSILAYFARIFQVCISLPFIHISKSTRIHFHSEKW